MGISGDMTLAVLIDAGVDAEAIRAGVASLDLPDVELQVGSVVKGGFRATSVHVAHPEQHAHRHLSDITQLINSAEALTDAQRSLAQRIFEAVATAEAKVHGSTLEKVHFHEVGAIDSIVDIVGAAIGFDLLGVDQVISSAVPTGRGQIHIDHGVCTVPAPGTAELLKGMPLVDVPVEAELTTPTGAAILKVMVDRFGPLPEMTIEEIGYGAGTKDFPDRANLLRMFVGRAQSSPESDCVFLLETNLDDVSAEIIGFARTRLTAAGALDVWSVPVQMKKDRSGVVLSVLARPADVNALEAILLSETGTFGVRRHAVERSKRAREAHNVETAWGTIEGKLGRLTGERTIFTPEFESCAAIARQHGIPLRDVYRAAEAAFDVSGVSMEATQPSAPTHDHHHDHDHDHDHDP